ncbi:M36 family metallopeptidase [Tahibacter soli]|uniref:M36 family metallopeptidase n=1 Tax=Tahibacter soli TaxID=2983605 RepID=A0A9X4BH87_9GAMM|nr:M36 family metallopeptidase [Tahibacter soli]MDC8012521.1 M36 family metallopeptidase [Tahibacter soli]
MYAKRPLQRISTVALWTLLANTGAATAAGRAELAAQPGWLGAAEARTVAKTAPTHAAIVAAARAAVAAHGGHGGDSADVRVLTTKAGTHAVTFVPRVDGEEVVGARTNVLLDRGLAVRAITGNVPAGPVVKRAGNLDAGAALKFAAGAIDGLAAASGARELSAGGDATRQFALDASVGFVPSAPSRVERVRFPAAQGLDAAWRVTLVGRRPGDERPIARQVLVAADDGRVLGDVDLIREHQPFSYRVFASAGGTPYADNYGYTAPHPTGVADGWRPAVPAPMNLVSRVHGGIATGDPWLADDATETAGNNTDAFFNAVSLDADGYCYDDFVLDYRPAEGDLRARTTGARTFDYAFDTNDTANDFVQCDPETYLGLPIPATSAQLNAKVVQMFYATNVLHDWYYDLGFTETAGNMQRDNYGRGGVGGDPLIANAGNYGAYTMVTPEGISPVINLGINNVSLTQRDSSAFDYGVLGHEWLHAVMGRLVPLPYDASVQLYALGEGTADFAALMAIARADDRNVYPGKPAFSGAYPGAGAYSNLEYDHPRDTLPPAGAPGNPDNSYYHGVRRFPYSADMTVNPLSLRHISDEHPTPANLPKFDWKLRSLTNAYIHTAGEVWASALWQCARNVIAAQPAHAFAATRDRVMSNVLAGLALFPSDPTYTQARDAVLFALRADDEGDYRRCRAGFAARGFGAGAIAPDARSVDLAGVVESRTDAEHALDIVGVALVETAGDGDGILDRGETGRLDVTLQNTGFSNATAQFAAAPYLGGYSLSGNGLADPVAIPPGARRTVAFSASVTSRTGRANLPFAIVALDTARPWVGALKNASFLVNADRVRDVAVDAAASDATFAVDWTPGFGPRTNPTLCSLTCLLTWQRARHDGVDAYRVADGAHMGVDATLDSAPFVVDASTPFVVTLRHAHDFRTTGDPLATYNGRGQMFVNLGGSEWYGIGGFTGSSNGWTTSTLGLGTSLAGMTVRLRLQATVPPSFSADPTFWAVSRVEVQGATPFTRLVDDVN